MAGNADFLLQYGSSLSIGDCDMRQGADISASFYKGNARRYAEVSHNFIQSIYSNVSHPRLKGDSDVIARLQELVPPISRGLDAGCGAGARDVFLFWEKGYDIYGVDAVEENILEAQRLHPEIEKRVSVADLREPLSYADASFDFVICNAVIQHITPRIALGVTLPELARVLKPGGVLQLVFKVGKGIVEVYDKDYVVNRGFQLYSVDEILKVLTAEGLAVIPEEDGRLGGVLYFTDPKPMDHCLIYLRKAA